jgi:hypothetical protein
VYVSDALTIELVKNRLGRPLALRQIDGTTIKPLIDYATGGYPVPPALAFIQYIKGSAYTGFTSDQIMYRPFRPRSWCIYGQSRVENVLRTMAVYELHQQWTADYFTQGNVPEAAYLTDPTVADLRNEEKFIKWQETLDKTAGVNDGRRRIHLIPSFVKDVKTLKAFSWDKDLPDWLIRILCIEFGIPSHLFVSETNRATAKETNEVLYEATLRLDLMSVKRLFDDLLEMAGYPELEFTWSKELDYRKEAVEGVTMLVDKGIMTTRQAAAYLGIDEENPEDPEEGTGEGERGDVADAGATEDEGDGAEAPATGTDTKDGGVKWNVVAMKGTKVPRVGKAKGKKFAGRGASQRAILSTALGGAILKRRRKMLSEIMVEGTQKAKARMKKVVP